MADFDINNVIGDIVGKAAGDNDLLNKLKDNPAKALEDMTGIDIPDEQIDAVVEKLGGIDGLVADFTKEGGIENVVEAAEKAMGESAGGIGDMIGSILGGKK